MVVLAKRRRRLPDYTIRTWRRGLGGATQATVERGRGRVLQLADGRGVAQSGSALAWGARGRWFESNHPDHLLGTK